jgi:predicted enzyme related to lactoylglutathione lyase
MAFTNVFAGIPVADYDAALVWYERLLGRPPDLVPNENEAAWQLTESGWFYVIGDAERAGKAVLTLLVDDLDDRIAGLTERGLAIDTLGWEVPGSVRKAVITDPDGNTIALGEVTNERS